MRWLGVVLWVVAQGQPLPPWTRGTLDIHQLSTGRGNAAFFIFPDGTTMLFDAGAAEQPEETAAFIAGYARLAPRRWRDASLSGASVDRQRRYAIREHVQHRVAHPLWPV